MGLVELRDGLAKVYGGLDFDFDSVTLDPDADRNVTADDFARWMTLRFNALDRNSDSVIARDELYRAPAQGGRTRERRVDPNGPY